jgi:general secretion pathway protein D
LCAQDQEPHPRPAQGATAPLRDPTQPDAELRKRLGATGPGGAPTAGPTRLGPIVPKAIVALGADRITAVVELGDVQFTLVPGATFAHGGRTLRVTTLTGERLVLRDEGLAEDLVVELGSALPPAQDPRLARIDLRGVPLEQAARLLADRSGLNVVVSALAAPKPVSLYLGNVEPLVAVQSICEANQLWWRRDATTGVVRISTADEYQADVRELMEDRTESFTLHYPNVFDVGRALRELYGDRVVVRTASQQDDSLLDLANRLSRFDLFDGRQQGFGQTVAGNGQQNGAFGSQSRFGSGFGSAFGAGFGAGYDGSGYGQYQGQGAYGGGNQFDGIQQQAWTAQQIQRLEQALARIEAGNPAAAQDVQKELAGRTRAPIYVTVAARQNKVVVRTADAAALEQIRELVRTLDVPTALVLLEVRVLSVDNSDGFESFFEHQWARSTTAGQMTTGTIAPPAPGALGPGGTGIRSGDLLFQYVDSRFAARMQLLERDRRVRSLATPILLTANNEVSRLFVGKEVPINRSFFGGATNQNQNTTTTTTGTTSIEFRPVGTTLLMTPSINADRTVSLKIVQEQSNVDSSATVLVPSAEGFVPQNVNVVSSQTVSGTIVAKSELAVAFGGLVETGKQDSVEKVPLLGDIPLLGMLFRRDQKLDYRREIVIVVRPFVIGTPAEQVDRSAEVLRGLGVDVERLEPKGASGEPGAPLFGGNRRFRIHGVEAPAGGGR